MNLTEGQLFTIEALNRIEGFEWPEKAKFAEVDGGCIAYFYESDSTGSSPLTSVRVKDPYDKRKINASITREQFDSVDGWVLFGGIESPVSGDCAIDVKYANGTAEINFSADGYEWNWRGDGLRIVAWRYHKPTKENEMQQPKPFKKRDCIETLIDKRKDAIEQKRLALAALEEAEAKERELMLSIQAWAESYGFDIRTLDESDEKPEHESELVITDWRDLRVGDVVEITGCDETDAWNRFRGIEVLVSKIGEKERDVMLRHINLGVWWLRRGTKWKFIRRPSK